MTIKILKYLTKRPLKESKTFVSCTKAATAIEYGLIVAGTSVAISVLVFTMGDSVGSLFNNIDTSLETASESTTPAE